MENGKYEVGVRCECWGEDEQTHPPHNTPCTSHTFTNFKQSQPAHFHQLACGRFAARLRVYRFIVFVRSLYVAAVTTVFPLLCC